MPAIVLAHQGGWDEILMVLGSLSLIGLLFAFAHHRASALARQRSEAAPLEREG